MSPYTLRPSISARFRLSNHLFFVSPTSIMARLRFVSFFRDLTSIWWYCPYLASVSSSMFPRSLAMVARSSSWAFIASATHRPRPSRFLSATRSTT